MAELPPLLQALCKHVLPGDVKLVETHISWVLLNGEYAYKIKKPVNFGFLDFSTLASRHQYCLEEVRLNRRLAPELYLGVCAIKGSIEYPVFDGAGPVLEYTVKLKRFDESGLADRLLESGDLSAEFIDGLARDLALFHGDIPRASLEDTHGLPETVLAASEHNFEHLLPVEYCPEKSKRIENLLSWTRAEYQKLRNIMQARKAGGFVRECHGDLHCGNLVLINGRLIPFDCIEFSENLRWIDCLSEIAFLLMDIAVRGRFDLGWRLLNRYLEITGDYAGLTLLDFYRVYRAMVRAKIARLSLVQADDKDKRADLQALCLRYLDYAERAASLRKPVLLITHGFSGSGKSYLACALAERLPAIRIASDIERKRLAGLETLARSGSRYSGGIYSEAITRQTYALLLNHAECLLQAGHNVLLDATYLRAAERDACRALAEKLGARFFILDLQTPEALLRERIAQRLARGSDPSEADLTVLARQINAAEVLASSEQPFVVSLDEAAGLDLGKVIRVIGNT